MLLTVLCGLSLAASFALRWTHARGAHADAAQPDVLAAYAAVVFGLYHAIRSAVDSARNRSVDVNFLMVLAAFGAVAVGRPEDAAALLFLFSLSSTLEELTMARTKDAIEGLIKLRPDEALLIAEDGEAMVPVSVLRVGDRIRVRPYDTVPADATITEGSSSLDQSSMTGESQPALKTVGDRILTGTQNLEGMLVARVESRVGETTLEKIVALVREAQENKASGERIAAWFGQRYTFLVLGAFAVALTVRLFVGEAFQPALYAALVLLVALSPCALVISTPATTLSALAWAARHGMLIRGGEFIEAAGQVRAIAFDKTGTLTTGKPAVVEVSADPDVWAPGEAIRLAAAVDQHSSHPVAEAIVRAAEGDVPPVIDSQMLSGMGVTGIVEDLPVALAQERYFEDMPEAIRAEAARMRTHGLTVAVLRADQRWAVIGLLDAQRPQAQSVIAQLRKLGIQRMEMLSGDNTNTAEAVGGSLGLDAVRGGLLPAQKTEYLESLEKTGPIMMVGDGVNDAPSLAKARVGVAMGGLGSDIALNAADVVLMDDRLERIVDLVKLGRATERTIRANLFFAGGMIIFLTLASFTGRLPLPLAVVGHEGSTVIVILNGLRLLRGPR